MLRRIIPLLVIALLAAACSSAPAELEGFENPERAVVAWFEAIDDGDTAVASKAVHEESMALILGIENGLSPETMAEYLDDGVPPDMQEAYWSSFNDSFVEFAAMSISTLTVGESVEFSAEGVGFAAVPVTGGSGGTTTVIARQADDGSWEIDLVATLSSGFGQLLASGYDALPAGEAGDRVRQAYRDTVSSALWAAMADGSFGDDFTRTAMALLERLEG